MPNSFGGDIIIEAPDPMKAAAFYVEQLGFEITAREPMIELKGPKITLYIEQGPTLGPVFEVFVPDVDEARKRLVANGCVVVKDQPDWPRVYVKDPMGLIYNLSRG